MLTDGRTDVRTDGRTDEQTDERTNGRKLARLCLPAKADATKMAEKHEGITMQINILEINM